MKRDLPVLAVIAALALGVVACEPPDPACVGIWTGSDMPSPSFHYDVVFTLSADGDCESLLYDVGGTTLQDMSSRGTYTYSAGVLHSEITQLYISGSWTSSSMTYDTPCSVAGDTLTMSVDFTGDGIPEYDWVLTRQ